MPPLRNIARAALGALVAGLLGLSVHAQTGTGVDKSDERLLVDRPSVLAPAIPPTFAAIAARGPVVDIPVSADGGWYYMPPVLQWEWFEQATTDPVVHVVINPPFSGHPTQAEDFLLQIPVTNPVPPAERGLMIGFHGYGLSVAQIFGIAAGVTDLPQYCTDNGWFLLAPTGLTTTSMGSLPSQTALEVILALTVGIFDFSWDKMYTYGFSMGATSATSFALRHQDPYTLRTAAIIHHTGTVDVVRELSDEPAPVLDLWASDTHFGDYFTSDPFAYNRVNPARFDAAGTGFEEEWFTFDGPEAHAVLPARERETTHPSSSVGMPCFATSSPHADLRSRARWGGPILPRTQIFSIDYADALGYISQFELGPLPTSSEVFADRPARYLWSKLISGSGAQRRALQRRRECAW